MLSLLLVACTSPDTDATDTGALADTDTVDTVDEVSAWTKYKVDSASTLRGLHVSTGGVYVVGSRGQAWFGSATEPWTAFPLPTELAGVDLNGVWGSGSGETLQMAIAADDGLVATLTSGNWTVWTLGTGANLAVDGTTFANLFVAGDNGLQRFDGSRWIVESEPPVAMNAVFAHADGVFAAGNEGVVMARDAAGAWTELLTNRAANFFAINGVGTSDLWVAGDQGVLLHWTGTAWTQVDSGTTDTLNALFVGSTASIVAVGNDGATVKFDGESWSPLVNETNQNLYAVNGMTSASAWAVGNGGLAMLYVSN